MDSWHEERGKKDVQQGGLGVQHGVEQGGGQQVDKRLLHECGDKIAGC